MRSPSPMPAFGGKADIGQPPFYVCFRPKADIPPLSALSPISIRWSLIRTRRLASECENQVSYELC